MKAKMFLLALILVSSSLYSSELPVVSIRVPGYEKESYQDILRILNKEEKEMTDKKMDKMKIVTFYKGNSEDDVLSRKENTYSGNNFHTIGEVLEKGKDAYTEEEINSLERVNIGPSQKFYFGNGNIVEDIVYLNKVDYDNKKKKLINEDQSKYVIEGKYEVPFLTKEPVGWTSRKKRKINPLNMSMEDYNTHIKGKSEGEVLTYLQSKLSEGSIKTYIENGKLYTKDDKGEKWPVLWDIKPVRIRVRSKLEEIVWEKIHVYVPNSEKNDSFGGITYSKDKSIYLEDKLDYTSNLKIKAEEVFNYKSDSINLPNIEYGKISLEGIERIVGIYSEDKDEVLAGIMTEEKFNEKWGQIRTEYFEDRYKLAKGKINKAEFSNIWNPANINKADLERDNNELKDLEDAYKQTNSSARGASNIRGNTDLVEIKKIFDEEIAKIEADLIKYSPWPYGERCKKELIEFYNAYRALLIKEKEFYSKYKAALLDSNVILSKKSKELNLVGQGRINGTIDMGGGFNTLTINEPGTGKYGSNIIFGPYSKLENIHVLKAGRAYADKNGSISGEYSMIVDIDENVKNANGEIDQHLLKNSDPNIIFKPWSFLERDFKIGLMVSRINGEEVINMGRKLYSEEGDKTYNIDFVSDSIAHQLSVKDREKGIIKVEIKDAVDGLNKDQNKVYQSIKNAKEVGALSETLTSSNKTTIFGGNRSKESLDELKILTDEITLKNVYTQLGKISKNGVDNFTYLLYNKEKNQNKNNDVYVNGGYVSNRMVENSLKGDTYSGYGLYQISKENFSIGAIFGGSNSNYEEVVDDSFDAVSTNSKIKGTSAYLGGYIENNLKNNFSSISGIGLQYGEYETTRNLKNNYQNLNFKSKTNVNNINLYTGLMYNIPLENKMNIEIRGIISYDFVNQNEIKEEKTDLSMNLDEHNYNFLDGEVGLKLNKILYSDNSRSELSGGIYYSYGFLGYDNNDISARINNSTSDFVVKGKDYEKDMIKFSLSYNVIKDFGLTYGILCGYSKNDDMVNIKTGVNIGYKL